MKPLATPLLFAIPTFALIISLLSATGFCEEEKSIQKAEATVEKPTDWELITIDGKSYLADSDIAKFYQFQRFTHDTEKQSAFFQHPRLVLILNSDGAHEEITVNNIPISLLRKTIWEAENNRILLSSADLTWILEPVIRPSYIRIKNPEAERNRPYFFTVEGDETLIKKFDLKKLVEKCEYHGLKVVRERGDSDVIHTRLVFELGEDTTKPDRVSTQWFMKQKDKEFNPLAIAFAMAIHSHLSHTKSLEVGVLSSREIDEDDQLPARADVIFTLGESFDSFEQIHQSIADGIGKNRRSVGRKSN